LRVGPRQDALAPAGCSHLVEVSLHRVEVDQQRRGGQLPEVDGPRQWLWNKRTRPTAGSIQYLHGCCTRDGRPSTVRRVMFMLMLVVALSPTIAARRRMQAIRFTQFAPVCIFRTPCDRSLDWGADCTIGKST